MARAGTPRRMAGQAGISTASDGGEEAVVQRLPGAAEVVTSWSVGPLRPFGAPPPEGEVLVPGGGGFRFCALLLRFLFVVRTIGLGIVGVVGVFGLELVCGLFAVSLGWLLWLW